MGQQVAVWEREVSVSRGREMGQKILEEESEKGKTNQYYKLDA